MASNIAQFETLRSIAFGSITSSFTPIGNPFLNTLRMFRIVNNSDGDVFISTDGINDQLFVPAGTFVLYDVAANSGIDSNFRIQAGTQFYVAYSSAPSKNSVYVEAIYGRGE
jgi:hypothetical protein